MRSCTMHLIGHIIGHATRTMPPPLQLADIRRITLLSVLFLYFPLFQQVWLLYPLLPLPFVPAMTCERSDSASSSRLPARRRTDWPESSTPQNRTLFCAGSGCIRPFGVPGETDRARREHAGTAADAHRNDDFRLLCELLLPIYCAHHAIDGLMPTLTCAALCLSHGHLGDGAKIGTDHNWASAGGGTGTLQHRKDCRRRVPTTDPDFSQRRN